MCDGAFMASVIGIMSVNVFQYVNTKCRVFRLKIELAVSDFVIPLVAARSFAER